MIEIKHILRSSVELELVEFGTPFHGAIHGVAQSLCSFIVNSSACWLLITQKFTVKTRPHTAFKEYDAYAFWLACIWSLT